MGKKLESTLESEISKEGTESDDRKGDRSGGRLVVEGLRPHLFSVSCSPCFHSWLPVENTRHVLGKGEVGSEYVVLDLRVRKNEYLPVLGDEEFNPPWRL